MTRNHSHRFRARRQEVQAEIVRRVAAGETLAAVRAEADMPSPQAVQVWRAVSEGFNAEMRATLAQGRSLRPMDGTTRETRDTHALLQATRAIPA
ncbi:MAG: hypothetical protein JNK30_01480 [Phenylobacterium sp.]|uniref:hypothetical protein n=1 Tax=Phenylobacterium sp. TaxID=1871053 RepID=UPI001A48F50D|nr:hypothetical protein [Phenylobacterium sp.]MBL8770027.1 hypothetical protein [Phenylobacterium sp.]